MIPQSVYVTEDEHDPSAITITTKHILEPPQEPGERATYTARLTNDDKLEWFIDGVRQPPSVDLPQPR